MIFGCRYMQKDFLHQDYLKDLEKKQYITLLTAFSRDQNSKVYVQHKVKENGKEMATLILENLENIRIFICGNAKYMPQQVKDTFIEILAEKMGDEHAAKACINSLQKKKQFQIEAW